MKPSESINNPSNILHVKQICEILDDLSAKVLALEAADKQIGTIVKELSDYTKVSTNRLSDLLKRETELESKLNEANLDRLLGAEKPDSKELDFESRYELEKWYKDQFPLKQIDNTEFRNGFEYALSLVIEYEAKRQKNSDEAFHLILETQKDTAICSHNERKFLDELRKTKLYLNKQNFCGFLNEIFA